MRLNKTIETGFPTYGEDTDRPSPKYTKVLDPNKTEYDREIELGLYTYGSSLIDYTFNCLPALGRAGAQDVVQNLFIEIHVKGWRVLGTPTFGSLKTRALWRAKDALRSEKTITNGGKVLTNYYDEQEGEAAPDKSMVYDIEEIEKVEKKVKAILVAVKDKLSKREKVLSKVIRKKILPSDFAADTIFEAMSENQKKKFKPRKPQKDKDKYVRHQVSKSLSYLRKKLRDERDKIVKASRNQ